MKVTRENFCRSTVDVTKGYSHVVSEVQTGRDGGQVGTKTEEKQWEKQVNMLMRHDGKPCRISKKYTLIEHERYLQFRCCESKNDEQEEQPYDLWRSRRK